MTSGRQLPPAPPGRLGIAITLAGIALMAVVVLLVEPLRDGVGNAIQGDTGALREELRDLGFGGVVIVLGLAMAHAVVFYPAEILDAAAGFVYGFWPALALVMAGWMLNAVLSYWIGRHAARPLMVKVFGEERFTRFEGAVERGGVTFLLAVRFVPIFPFSLSCYVCGSARVPFGTYMWTTAVGYLPITALSVYVGTRLDSLELDDPLLWLSGVVLIVMLVLGHRLAPHFRRPVPANPDAEG